MPSPKSRKRHCDVALLVDQETGNSTLSGTFIVDRGSVESQVLRVLRQRYDRVAVVPYLPNGDFTSTALRALHPRLVFNLTEWIDGDRSRDHLITHLLDKLGLPYSGTAGEGLRLTRDKVRAKSLVASLGVATPRHCIAGFLGGLSLPFPLFVKPQYGDGSDAISNAALVRTRSELRARVKSLQSRKMGPLLYEEYIEGRDLFVALLGNKPQVVRPLELVVGRQGRGAPRFATQRLKHDDVYKRRWKVSYRKAQLPRSVTTEICDASQRIFHALKLRDYARIDYRLTFDNRLVFIEANANPDLGRHTFGREQCFAGVAYEDLIRRIVSAALRRYRR